MQVQVSVTGRPLTSLAELRVSIAEQFSALRTEIEHLKRELLS